MAVEVGENVLCTVDRIVGTVVFVKIEGETREGSIILSEIAPGRIRNLREYVVPKKKIVCKVLRVSENRIDLSLRRVTQKEKKEVLERFNKEKSYRSILKTVVGERAEKIEKEIEKKNNLYNLFEETKKNPKIIEEFVGKENAKKIFDILKTQKIKKTLIKKEVRAVSTQENGLELIKNLFSGIKDAKIKYLSAGRYSIETESEEIKRADNRLKEIINQLEEKSKKAGIEFSINQ